MAKYPIILGQITYDAGKHADRICVPTSNPFSDALQPDFRTGTLFYRWETLDSLQTAIFAKVLANFSRANPY